MLDSRIDISVLMAVYNTDFTLVKRAIESVLQQTFPYFELIIVNDGSDNVFLPELLSFIQLHKSKIIYFSHNNIGQSQSINKAITKSKGKYITILDADDEYKSNHLELCVEQMNEYDLIASTTETITDEDADFWVTDKHDDTKLIHVDDCILFATLFGKREVFNHLKFEDKYAADADFYEIASQKYRVAKLPLKTYTYYRNNAQSITAKRKLKFANNILAVD